MKVEERKRKYKEHIFVSLSLSLLSSLSLLLWLFAVQFSFFFFTALITRFFQLMSFHVIYRINISNVSNSLYLLFFHFSSYDWWWKWLDRKIFANLLGFLFLFEILTQLSFLINLYFFHVKFLPKSYVVTETGIK